ncbi:hypothetical protein MMC31_001496 [Peltigera leucophlebia]|nr:hypothetical protein [Peltigera leucophlebia]
MADKDAGTPRVYLVRHGETEWTKSGRYTGITELELTPNGIQQVLNSKRLFIGHGRLLDVTKLARIFISPRQRAVQTFEVLFDSPKNVEQFSEKVKITNDLAEWDYGEYEGLLTKEIREKRKQQGLDTERDWDIWRDGCVDGETPRHVTNRLDHLIEKIYEIQRPYMHGERPADVVLVAHGHLLRAFAKRWLKYPLEFPLSMMLEPGAIGTLR